jgi:hypothetical protein
MTAFFDDFNSGIGTVNQTLWNTAYDYCVDPGYGYFFLNPQYHVHDLLRDREDVVCS